MVIEQDNTVDESLTWGNNDNASYFEKVPYMVLSQYTVKGGIDKGCDIDLVFPYIKNTSSLIEAGAGYGRVVKSLLDRGYKGKIYAVERSQNLCKQISNDFKESAEVICDDIQNYVPLEKVDAVLFMWSSISEFPKSQHLKLLSHMISWLKLNGILIIETISHLLIPQNADCSSKQFYSVETEYGKVNGYLPSSDEIELVSAQLGFKVKKIPYQTETGRDRIIHILSR
ncbi:MAG: class I SAM-dependent methyltransferase [Gammaproteobacteria bacterium]|nr:class I SAM-dependent methyltransferase [Gammaproteobacteria bacterium]